LNGGRKIMKRKKPGREERRKRDERSEFFWWDVLLRLGSSRSRVEKREIRTSESGMWL